MRHALLLPLLALAACDSGTEPLLPDGPDINGLYVDGRDSVRFTVSQVTETGARVTMHFTPHVSAGVADVTPLVGPYFASTEDMILEGTYRSLDGSGFVGSTRFEGRVELDGARIVGNFTTEGNHAANAWTLERP